jgi:hypothetical protein
LWIADPDKIPKIFVGNVSFPSEAAGEASNEKNKQVNYG